MPCILFTKIIQFRILKSLPFLLDPLIVKIQENKLAVRTQTTLKINPLGTVQSWTATSITGYKAGLAERKFVYFFFL